MLGEFASDTLAVAEPGGGSYLRERMANSLGIDAARWRSRRTELLVAAGLGLLGWVLSSALALAIVHLPFYTTPEGRAELFLSLAAGMFLCLPLYLAAILVGRSVSRPLRKRMGRVGGLLLWYVTTLVITSLMLVAAGMAIVRLYTEILPQ